MFISFMTCSFNKEVRLIAQVFLNTKPKPHPVPNMSESKDLTSDLHWLTEGVL